MHRLAALAFSLALAAPGGPRQSRILGGVPDGDDPEVVGLTSDTGWLICSGTVVDPVHVVTAAHCLVDSANAPSIPAFVFTCSDTKVETLAASPQCYSPVASGVIHPAFDIRVGLGDDIAVVTAACALDVPAKPLAAAGLTAADLGQPVRVVGYGTTSQNLASGGGAKYQALSPIEFLGPGTSPRAGALGAGQFEKSGFPGTCFGDSGGPAFYPANDAGEALVGITSYAQGPCTDYGVDTSVAHYACWLSAQGVAAASCPAADGGPRGDAGAPCRWPDAGSVDAGGAADGGTSADAGAAGKGGKQGGCGCGAAGTIGAPALLAALSGRGIVRRRRGERSGTHPPSGRWRRLPETRLIGG